MSETDWFKYLKDQPCLICGGIEGCDHTVEERKNALIEHAREDDGHAKPLKCKEIC